MDKPPAFQNILNSISKSITGKEAKPGIKCMTCNDEIDPNGFRDDLSLKEFSISGMCQKCQDSIFDEGDD